MLLVSNKRFEICTPNCEVSTVQVQVDTGSDEYFNTSHLHTMDENNNLRGHLRVAHI